MIEGSNIIGFSSSKKSTQTIQAFNPGKNSLLPDKFNIATKDEVGEAVGMAKEAFDRYKNFSGRIKADFLEKISDEIMSLGDELIQRACAESGLPEGRITGERGRTVGQLRMFAELLRNGSWVDARIEKGDPNRKPAPKPDIRRMLFPIGPVAVFGASNFPLAFSTAGGDTASALAAGCPVVVKGHESHPGTNEMVARAIRDAAKSTGMPDGVFSSLNGGPDVGSMLVQHKEIKAVGFTGSFRGGKAIYDLAQKREAPIPVYAEMGSINPVFLLNERLNQSASEIAENYASSVSLGVGQFCTNPGIIIGLAGKGLNEFKSVLSEKLKETPPGCMLNPGIAENYRKRRAETLVQQGIQSLYEPADTEGTSGSSAVAMVEALNFLNNEKFQEEVFGPFTLIVACADNVELIKVAEALKGQLTVTFMATEDELPEYHNLINVCREKAGRIIFNGVPTGVEVCSAMQHGGPFPATTDSKFTSVGTAAILRFVRPVAFQDCPDSLLPDELKENNPLQIYRLVNGKMTQ